MRLTFLAAALAVALPAAAADHPAAQVVAAERAFAADGEALGLKDSFLKHSAPEAIVFNPDPTLAKAVFANASNAGPPLIWWPLWAGVSKSGDLGFTSGPWERAGKRGTWFFTVWARQADGGWKWIFDGGAPSLAEGQPGKEGAVTYARVAAKASGSPSKAMSEVSKVEIALAAAAKADAKAAYLAVLADDGRVVGSKSAPPKSRADVEAELGTRAVKIAFSPLGGSASSAGDLAWTYGSAHWAKDGADQRGHYVRIWRNDAAGWRLVFDELIEAPPPKAPPTS